MRGVLASLLCVALATAGCTKREGAVCLTLGGALVIGGIAEEKGEDPNDPSDASARSGLPFVLLGAVLLTATTIGLAIDQRKPDRPPAARPVGAMP
jgi:hypothetical protein